MSHVYKDKVKQDCTAPTTTSPFDFDVGGSTPTGFQSFATALATSDTCYYHASDTSGNWETGLGTWSDANNDLTRTTIHESSNSGSAETFSGTVTVSLVASAIHARNSFLAHEAASVTTANVTGVVGTMHYLDLSGLTANRDFVLPATAAVNDRVGVYVSAGHNTNELLLKPDAADTLQGGAAGAEWSRLFITGETVVFRCVTANSAWVVEQDNRIASVMHLRLSVASNHTTGGTSWLTPTSTSTAGTWVAERNTGDCGSTTNGTFTTRRAGFYTAIGRATPTTTISDQNYWGARVQNNTAASTFAITRLQASGAIQMQYTYGGASYLAADVELAMHYQQQEANKGLTADSTFIVMESLVR